MDWCGHWKKNLDVSLAICTKNIYKRVLVSHNLLLLCCFILSFPTSRISSSTEAIFSMRHFHVNMYSLTTLNLSIHQLLWFRGLTSIWFFLSLVSFLAYGMTIDHYFLTSYFFLYNHVKVKVSFYFIDRIIFSL